MEPPEDEEPLSWMTEVVCTVCAWGLGVEWSREIEENEPRTKELA
jgi:hypothetical protein